MEIEIRKINETEGSILRHVRLSALRDSPWAFGATLSEEEGKPLSVYEAEAKRHAYSKNSTTFLALKNNEVVGQIGAFFQDEKAYICAMWVSPIERRSYLGSNLFQTAKKWLLAHGATYIYAWVADTNKIALNFYKKLGFVSTNITKTLPSNMKENETLYVHKNS